MITQTIAHALNTQVGREFYSAYFYLSMSAHSDSLGLKGFARWFMAKYQEELLHAMKIYQYILNQSAQVKLLPIEQPPSTFEGPLAMYEATLAHEQQVTKSLNNLIDLAMSERDHATQIFLHWFITEQIEEEATVSEIIAKIKLVGGRGDGLFMIDNQVGQTVSSLTTTAPAAP
jgi:ferritin